MISLGVDIAGMDNTWVTSIDNHKKIQLEPQKMTLEQILIHCLKPDVSVVVIDSPLSYAIDEENGMRNCDEALREMLDRFTFSRNYVASSNSLSAVTSRGRQLAEELRKCNYKGKILETVPRFCLGQMAIRYPSLITAVEEYKTDQLNWNTHRVNLWREWWLQQMSVAHVPLPTFNQENEDGKLDSMVCASIGHFYIVNKKKITLYRHIPKGHHKTRGFVKGIHVLSDPSGVPFFVPNGLDILKEKVGGSYAEDVSLSRSMGRFI
ncbi:DUF429 domain-containing protein [Brevibacillus sp. 179-C9.3 HS]|uniref:DUF429 domain-containing protein n=1 Tax=unclassified Brevibacillus TaxID=2684853 RepID=UPI00399FD81F